MKNPNNILSIEIQPGHSEESSVNPFGNENLFWHSLRSKERVLEVAEANKEKCRAIILPFRFFDGYDLAGLECARAIQEKGFTGIVILVGNFLPKEMIAVQALCPKGVHVATSDADWVACINEKCDCAYKQSLMYFVETFEEMSIARWKKK